MATQSMNGSALAKKTRLELKTKVDQLGVSGKPKLAVVIVGEDKASHIYVGSKERACKEVGISSLKITFPEDVTQHELEKKIEFLADDPTVHGILLQLPLPESLDKHLVLEKIPPQKDVDGLTSHSQGLLAKRKPGLRPCTPKGIIRILGEYKVEIAGKICAVIGRSTLVGAPITRMLEHRGATTISINRKTPNPKELCKMADILIVAAGSMHLVDHHWVSDGATVIDVGIHRNNRGLCGDVNFESVSSCAQMITPVPGGVGPMTVAMLLENCFEAYLGQQKTT